MEVADALLRLDMDIQRLIYQVEEWIGKENVLIFLTSTHGTAPDPDYSRAIKLPGGFFRYHNAMALLNSYLSAIYGEGNWIDSYVDRQVYLNEALIDQRKESFQVIQDQASRFLTHFEGVARALPSDRLVGGALTQTWGDLFQNSYQPDRTGDIMIILQPGWIEEDNHDTDSGSPYAYDRQVPLVWYGWRVKPALIDRPVSILDIAPTIARSIMIDRPEASTGTPLTEIFQ
jgi:arylsulfatase A-like enzyme